jgi:hypothetical protein
MVKADGTPISREEDVKLRKNFEDLDLELIRAEKPQILVEAWEWKPRGVIIVVESAAMQKSLEEQFLRKHGMKLIREEEVRKRKTFTGLLRGVTAKSTLPALQLRVTAHLKRLGMQGEITCEKLVETPTGGILYLRVDEDAEKSLGGDGFELVLGTSGKVKFTDPRRRSGTAKTTVEMEENRRRADALKKEAEALIKRNEVLEQQRAEETADLELNALNLENEAPTPMEASTEKVSSAPEPSEGAVEAAPEEKDAVAKGDPEAASTPSSQA